MALKQVFAAAAAVLALSTLTGTASADHRFQFGIYSGFPTNDCEWWGHNWHCYGSPFNGYYSKPEHMPQAYNRMSCNEAREMVQDRGFRKIKTKDCSGRTYAFTGTKKGHHYFVKVNAFTGRITTRPL